MALLTDFGSGSEYVGMVKGVILTHRPAAVIIDLFHDVAPQAVRQGAWVLSAACAHFPAGTVFCAVVDPGVGSERQAVAARGGPYWFVGPDNGLLYPALQQFGTGYEAVRLPVPATASPTFHGRDVFAPAAARLASGIPLKDLGRPADPLVPLTFHRAGRTGEVVHVDRFGNIITNLPPVAGRTGYRVRVGNDTTPRSFAWHPTYAAAPAAEPFLITGSAGTLEFAVPGGSAASILPLRPGDTVRID